MSDPDIVLLPLSPKNRNERMSLDSQSSASTTSLIFERIGERVVAMDSEDRKSYPRGAATVPYADVEDSHALLMDSEKDRTYIDDEDHTAGVGKQKLDKRFRRYLWIIGGIVAAAWVLGLVLYLGNRSYRHASADPHDPAATTSRGSGKQITLDQVQSGAWRPNMHDISWIEGPNGEDGYLLEQGAEGKDYLIVENVRDSDDDTAKAKDTRTLMKEREFTVGDRKLWPSRLFPSKDLKKVLIATDLHGNWRHSYYALYWIFDVETQTAEPLDHDNTDGRIQLASWSPQSDAVVFTRDSNMFLRKLSSQKVIQMTTDGGTEYFYGVPDWVYEEEVFQTNSATWWAEDGKYVALLRTNETEVPEYPVQYFLSRPSGEKASSGEEAYPEVRQIKYPKAGAPNPTVDLLFYDVDAGLVFDVKVAGGFEAHDLLITEVVWAGSTGKAIVRETNRESDILRVVLIDVKARTGKTVRTENVKDLDGGWFEVSQDTHYIPADPDNGRPHDGYIDTIIHGDGDHLGYFTPLDNPEPILLTSGDWEVVDAPSAIDLKKNLVYFKSTKEHSTQRHVYSVKLDGTDMQAMTDTTKEGYFDVSFSSGAGYALVNYFGPDIPHQRLINTPSNDKEFERVVETNQQLADLARVHELPIVVYSTVTIDGVDLNVMERRPPHFDPKKKYPVLFQLYNGPGAQEVKKVFKVDFQSYLAATHDYIVVTVDGRGTGFIGRKARTIIRDNVGHYESHDQIETAKIWAKKSYVDASRLGIWGWSYGGFMTLKVLERDAGQTFQYGMAVAPVTDWRFYDSIYTERYMHTPQNNPSGYDNSSISDVQALARNTRFLIMHGVSDDNVHYQNTLTLLDKLDLNGIENYDVHFFPDSDHGIYFHNANRIVYDSTLSTTPGCCTADTCIELNNWITNAFNGEWLRVANAKPKDLEVSVR